MRVENSYVPPLEDVTKSFFEKVYSEPLDPPQDCTLIKNEQETTVNVALPQDTAYVVDGTAQILSGTTLCNVVIIAPKIDVGSQVTLRDVILIANDPDTPGANISVNSDYDIDHVVLAARNNIDLQSDGTMGGAYCDSGGVTVQIYAGKDVNIQSNTTVSNTQILAEGNVGNRSKKAVRLTGNGATIQAKNNIWVASIGDFGACPNDGATSGSIVEAYIRLVD